MKSFCPVSGLCFISKWGGLALIWLITQIQMDWITRTNLPIRLGSFDWNNAAVYKKLGSPLFFFNRGNFYWSTAWSAWHHQSKITNLHFWVVYSHSLALAKDKVLLVLYCIVLGFYTQCYISIYYRTRNTIWPIWLNKVQSKLSSDFHSPNWYCIKIIFSVLRLNQLFQNSGSFCNSVPHGSILGPILFLL